MDENFLKQARKKILDSDNLSVEELAERLGVSKSQASRVLSGKGAYKLRYTPIIREYIGFTVEAFDDHKGNRMVSFDVVDLKDENSLRNKKHVEGQFSLFYAILSGRANPGNVKIVKAPSNHCESEYGVEDFIFVDTGSVLPEPSGVFLIWTGAGYRLQHCQHVIASNPPQVLLASLIEGAGSESVQISLSDAMIKGRVIGKISMTGT